MSDDTDLLMMFYEQDWEQARHLEEQRSTITNIVLVISSVIIGLISQRGLSNEMLPLTLLLIVLGLYGAIATQKLYERVQFSTERARAWRNRLSELHPDIKLLEVKEKADQLHAKKFPVWGKIRVHYVWDALHLFIALAGILLTLIILF